MNLNFCWLFLLRLLHWRDRVFIDLRASKLAVGVGTGIRLHLAVVGRACFILREIFGDIGHTRTILEVAI